MALVASGRFRPHSTAHRAHIALGGPRRRAGVVLLARARVGAARALVHYKKEVLRLIAEISMGTGALAVIGGTVVIVGFLTLFTGGTIAVQGFSSLGNIGVEALPGFFARVHQRAYRRTVIAGIGLAATIGAGSTAQLGAMRVSEEIDALESMAIPSVRIWCRPA